MNIKEFFENYLPDFPKPNFELPQILKKSEDSLNHRERALELEEKVLALSGLKPGRDIHIYDVPIHYNGLNHIHTIECGKKNQEVLILLHGYSGSLVLFYPMLKQLSQKYHVYCIDFLGMGLSSRPDFSCTTPEETMTYFVTTFEKWRKALKIKKYSLGGHSFGGYIAALCAYKNRNGLKNLYLLSPIGVYGGVEADQASEEWSKALGWTKTNFWLAYFKTYSKLYDDKITPNNLVKKFSSVSRIFIRKYMTMLIGEKAEDEADLLGDFLYEMLMIPGGSEQAIHSLFKPLRIGAHFPLAKLVFNEISDIPIYCYFGEEDWNDWTPAKKLSAESRNFNFELIPNAGHQITLQNPDQVVSKIITSRFYSMKRVKV